MGSNSGLLGLVSYRKKNFDITDLPNNPWEIFTGSAFTGGGQNLVSELSPGIQVSRFRLGFDDPYLFGTENSGGIDLQTKVTEIWPTPNCPGQNSIGSIAEWGGSKNKQRTKTNHTEKLNPNWVEQLQGIPVEWTQIEIE